MHIFLTRASGFIGSRFLKAFIAQGHEITCAVRSLPAKRPAHVQCVRADFSRHIKPEDWVPHLHNVDVVVNAAGIIREREEQSFAALHTLAPIALFEASIRKGVVLTVQISALAADEAAQSKYHLSKKAADDFLERRNVSAVVLQPSLVYGQCGASAALFDTLASMPVLARFGDGRQMVQPVHIDDLVDAVVHLLAHVDQSVMRIAVVVPTPMTLSEFLTSLRLAMQMGRPFVPPIPLALARLAARMAGKFKHSPLDRDTFSMLERGNIADEKMSLNCWADPLAR